MLKNKLTPYILVSVLIHTGFLLGTYSFLRLPDAELEPLVLIPVEMVVIREQPPDPALRLTASEPMATKKKDSIARSQLSPDMDADQHIDELADPIPKEGDYQPMVTIDRLSVVPLASERQTPAGQTEITLSRIPPLHISPANEQISEVAPIAKEIKSEPLLTVDTIPTSSVTPATPKGKEVASEPMILAFQMSFLHLSPVEPSSAAGSSPIDINTYADLVVAKVEVSPHDSQKGKEVASEPVDLAIQKTSLHLSAVAPSSPAGSTPVAISISADLVEAKAAVSPHDSQKGKEVASEPVDLAIQKTPVHLSAVAPSSAAGSVPIDISASADLVEAQAAVSPHYSQKGKEVASEPVDLAIQKTSLHLSAVEPSSPAGSTPLDISTSADLAEVSAAASPHFSQALHKAVTSLVDTQAGDDFVSGLRPLPMQVESDPRLMASTLQVQSQPNGAQVYVEGELIGESPLAWELPLGKYEVRLALPDHYDLEAQVELTETNHSIHIYFPLLPVD
ncbi:MAG: PEGA domain-containing protein [bacterium]|nr:PEGA domain-containing protein [bacterium]